MNQPETMDLARVDAGTFEPHVGEAFVVTDASAPTTLQLQEVHALADHSRGTAKRAPFSLLFTGPEESPLPQGIHVLEHDELGTIELFLVPIAAARYEAVFT